MQHTRHNLGIKLLRDWAGGAWRREPKLEAEMAEVTADNVKVVCLFPLTSINRSGASVARFKHPPRRTLIIHDDFELPLGSFRIKTGGSARGHKGVRSIHEALGTKEIPRLLLGTGPLHGLAEQFVLSEFTPAEWEKVSPMIPRVKQELDRIIKHKSLLQNPTDEWR